MDLQSIILSIYALSESSLHELVNQTETISYPKGHILSEAGKPDYYLYFLEKGIVRAYNLREGEEVTFWFGMEGSIICSMMNYIEKKPSYETIELLEDCLLHRIKTSTLEKLYSRNIELANWGRKYIEYEIIKVENRLIEQQLLSATERYDSLLKSRPTLIQRVPLGIIASYLGMTQVSLSRIRGKR